MEWAGGEEAQSFDACWVSLSWAVYSTAAHPKALYKFNASDNLQLAPILNMTHQAELQACLVAISPKRGKFITV